VSISLAVTKGESSSVALQDQLVGVVLSDHREPPIVMVFYIVGVAIVTHSKAYLWTDGRYHLQASQELDPTLWTLMRQGECAQ